MAGTLTANEEAQLLQTIEMFEVITQSQPDDYQSLEILKEAYSKLGREKDVISSSKRIAEAYVQLGQLSSAILEYESILQRFPDDPDVQNALEAIETRATNFPSAANGEGEIAEKTTPAMLVAPSFKKAAANLATPPEVDDGKAAMQKLFVDSKMVSAAEFSIFWPSCHLKEPPRHPAETFIQILADKQLLPLEKSLKLLSEKTRLGYLQIERYDVDVEYARTFPREICLRWTVLPFDRLSKSIFVATVNPYNKQAAQELEAHIKGRIIWYLASPYELVKIMKKIYR
ncbi:MAG: hypothetical protein ACO1QB_00615 [Verrucomicrobiales bacterium]